MSAISKMLFFLIMANEKLRNLIFATSTGYLAHCCWVVVVSFQDLVSIGVFDNIHFSLWVTIEFSPRPFLSFESLQALTVLSLQTSVSIVMGCLFYMIPPLQFCVSVCMCVSYIILRIALCVICRNLGARISSIVFHYYTKFALLKFHQLQSISYIYLERVLSQLGESLEQVFVCGFIFFVFLLFFFCCFVLFCFLCVCFLFCLFVCLFFVVAFFFFFFLGGGDLLTRGAH